MSRPDRCPLHGPLHGAVLDRAPAGVVGLVVDAHPLARVVVANARGAGSSPDPRCRRLPSRPRHAMVGFRGSVSRPPPAATERSLRRRCRANTEHRRHPRAGADAVAKGAIAVDALTSLHFGYERVGYAYPARPRVFHLRPGTPIVGKRLR